MKVSTSPAPKSFPPITLHITLQTEEEAMAFYDLFDLNHLSEVLSSYRVDGEGIRNAIKDKGIESNYECHSRLTSAAENHK